MNAGHETQQAQGAAPSEAIGAWHREQVTVEDLKERLARAPKPAPKDPPVIKECLKDVEQRLRAKSQDLARLTPERRTELEAEQAKREVEFRAKDEASRRHFLVTNIARGVGPRYSPERCSLATFHIYHPAQQKVVDDLGSMDLLDVVSHGGGLVFYGPCGSGKDHLAIALLYRAAQQHGIAGSWINGQDWYGVLRDRIDEGKREEASLAELTKPKVLLISDPIPARRDPTPWNLEMLYRLVDRRYRDLKSTWLTLNVENPEDADARLGTPAFDRLREGAQFIRCFWPSYRQQRKAC